MPRWWPIPACARSSSASWRIRPICAICGRAFRDARFLPSEGAGDRFRTHPSPPGNIVPAISTFSWLAAWLSEADRVFLPVLGLLNPAQNRAVDLLPLDDAALPLFLSFRSHYGCKVAHARQPPTRPCAAFGDPCRQTRLQRHARPHAPAAPEGAIPRRPSTKPSTAPRMNPDIAQAVAKTGHLPNGRHHYETVRLRRRPRRLSALDRAWYCRTYPDRRRGNRARRVLGPRASLPGGGCRDRRVPARRQRRHAQATRLFEPRREQPPPDPRSSF